MVREEWLRHAVELLDSDVFGGDLDLLNHDFQIACGKCGGKKLSETIQPYEGENVKLDDFFPTTILVNHSIKDPIDILGNLALECIHAFFGEKGNSKRFKKLAEKYYFDKPYSSYNPTPYLIDLLNDVYKKLKKTYGDWPGATVVVHEKEKKETKKNVIMSFCPECGYEIKISRKVLDKHGWSAPTCPCGAKMGLDMEDENEGTKDTED